MSLLHLPHHDGSPVYVSDEAPALGDTVTVRVRTSPGDPVEAIWLRTTYDAEPVFHPMATVADGPDAVWWEGRLPVHNPVTHYRFLIVRALAAGRSDQEWLTGAGLVGHDLPDASDFRLAAFEPAPDWGRDGVIYQIFPDRFARSAAAAERETPAWALPAAWDDEVVFEGSDPHTPLQLFGGDLDGITDHLDHIAEVGADIVYTTPVFPGESNHRYNATTFDEVDPLLGGDEAYARLSTAVHARGWRILGDLTTNHTGDTHEWFLAGRADPGDPHRSYYYFDDDGTYACWMGHGTLPKVNHANPALRAAMVEGPDSVVGRWLRPPYDVDGWRIDVANMTGRLGELDLAHEVARSARGTAAQLREDPLVIGEHNHDATGDVDGDGWHGTMNYSGFSWPVWSWLRDPASPARPFGRPVPVPRRGGSEVVDTFRAWQGTLGWRATCTSWNILGSHDSARIRTVVGGDAAVHRVAAGLQFTLPGVPMLFAGDELGLEGVTGEDARRPMPWDTSDEWDRRTLTTYADLSRLRRDRGRAATRRPALGARRRRLPSPSSASTQRGRSWWWRDASSGGAFTLPLGAARHLLGTEPGGSDLDAPDGGDLRSRLRRAEARRLGAHDGVVSPPWRCASWRAAPTRRSSACPGTPRWRSGPTTSSYPCRAGCRGTSCGSCAWASGSTPSRRPRTTSPSASTACCATCSGSACRPWSRRASSPGRARQGRRGPAGSADHPAPPVLAPLPEPLQPRHDRRARADPDRRDRRAAGAAPPGRLLLGRRVALQRAVPPQRRRVRGLPRRRRDRRAPRRGRRRGCGSTTSPSAARTSSPS